MSVAVSGDPNIHRQYRTPSLVHAKVTDVRSFHLDNVIPRSGVNSIQLHVAKPGGAAAALLETSAQTTERVWFHLDDYMAAQRNPATDRWW